MFDNYGSQRQYRNYSYDNSGFDGDGCLKTLGVIVGLIVFLVLFNYEALFFSEDLYVTDEKAIEYIKDISGADRVVILNDDGNENYIVHDMQDVTFDVMLYYTNKLSEISERAQFRCTDGFYRDIICSRGYNE